jgi:hypothetical protein
VAKSAHEFGVVTTRGPSVMVNVVHGGDQLGLQGE